MGEGNESEKHEEEIMAEQEVGKKLKEKKISWGRLRRVDSLSLEAGKVSMNASHFKVGWATTLSLAFQSIGVVYGDIGTSPLYVYASTFTDGIHNLDDILGVLSLILYTLFLIPLLKYVFIVLWANDNGDGGTFALYSLLCRYAKVGLIPNQQPEDKELSNYTLEISTKQQQRAQQIKEKLENSKPTQIVLFLVTIMGTAMVIGDGVLTPSISVLSATSGIATLGKGLGQDAIVGISVAILIILFGVQRFGTDKVGFTFAPIIFIWFSFLTGIGLYNLFVYDIGVLRAFNPYYIIQYFKRNGRKGWVSLGGVFLCITGTEAMFADLGHFNVRAIQLSFSCVAFPALTTVYCGQAAYLRKHPENVSNTFYDSIPDPLYWPMFVVAVSASIIASQAMISGAFSIIQQSLNMACFPTVKVVHTSAKYEGQVYIPEINYLLMTACVLVTVGFRTTEDIGHAYGIAVVTVMVITTCMISLIMLVIWKTNIVWVVAFCIGFGSIEIVYMSSVMYKFTHGGYLPIMLALVLSVMMVIWHYVHVQKYKYELKNKVSSEFTKELAQNQSINRIPGIGLLYSELVQGVSPIFTHFISNIPSMHSIFVMVSIKPIPISKVLPEERFLFRHVEPRDFRMFRCVVRYGYKDAMTESQVFEQQLVENLKEFIRHEHYINGGEEEGDHTTEGVDKISSGRISKVHIEDKLGSGNCSSRATRSANSSNRIVSGPLQIQAAEEEMQYVERAKEKGVVYFMGETEILAEHNSSLFKKFVVNYGYSFLKKNSRQGDKALSIPHSRLLKVGMTYEI